MLDCSDNEKKRREDIQLSLPRMSSLNDKFQDFRDSIRSKRTKARDVSEYEDKTFVDLSARKFKIPLNLSGV